VPTDVSGDDRADQLVGAGCQVELLPAIVDEELSFEDLNVPQCMPPQLCMVDISIFGYPYDMVCIFIGEVPARRTHIHKSFLFRWSPLVGFLDC
jgi:hypothetical protein